MYYMTSTTVYYGETFHFEDMYQPFHWLNNDTTRNYGTGFGSWKGSSTVVNWPLMDTQDTTLSYREMWPKLNAVD